MNRNTRATTAERLAHVISGFLRDDDVVFTGLATGRRTSYFCTGIPVAAALLAQRTHAPNLTLLLAGWMQNPRPGSFVSLPDAEFDPRLLSIPCEAHCSEYPGHWSPRRGDIDVGFLSAAQVDRAGNVNSVLITGHDHNTALVGPILQPEHMALFGREVIMMPRHDRRSFVPAVDYVSGAGFPGGRSGRAALGVRGGGPALVVSPLGVFDFDDAGLMRLRYRHPHVDDAALRRLTGFPVDGRDAQETPAPPPGHIKLLRTSIDPHRALLPDDELLTSS